jgi:hypothetical protein
MNIFITDKSPCKSAENLDDKRVVKMILESAQMLSTAHHELNSPVKEHVYRPTHVNHPCNVWVRATKGNYVWLYEHFVALCEEYTKRFGKIHKSFAEKNTYLAVFPRSEGSLTDFPNCAKNDSLGIDCSAIEDVCEAYKKYLTLRWDTDKVTPRWFKESDKRPF